METSKKYPKLGEKDTRSGFGDALLILGEKNEKVVGLCADLTGSLKMEAFAEKYPHRFFQCGIAEANMMGVAAGMANGGYVPFAATFANFATGRVYDQIRQSIAYAEKNVKICASHAGLTLGEDGATHQILEDIGLMRMLPGMTVINPCDYNQTKAATLAIAEYDGPVYLRFGRPKWPVFISEETPFVIGKALHLSNGSDITIVATGHMVWEALQAVELLENEGISVDLINIHTIKPLDTEAILNSVSKTGCCLVAEEHQIYGGLAELIAGVLGENLPVPFARIGVKDSFGESGKPMELLQKYGLTHNHIASAAKKLLERKK